MPSSTFAPLLMALVLGVPDAPDLERTRRTEARLLVGVDDAAPLGIFEPVLALEAERPAVTEPVAIGVEPKPRSKAVPALGLGASLGVGVVGAVFTARALEALSRTPVTRSVTLDSGRSLTIPDPDGLERQGQEILTNGLVAILCVSGAVAGLVTSTLLLLSD